MKKINYANSGVDYNFLDPIKKSAQRAAASTAQYLVKHSASEITATRGESAFVWKQGRVHMASMIEGLGTKNLVADAMQKITGKIYYKTIGHDTVATIINDLISVGATPLTIFAYFAVGHSDWFKDITRAHDLIAGWKKGCDEARVTWGGGETPSLKDIINPNSIDLGGSAVGIIQKNRYVLTEKKLRSHDRIVLIKSNGINTNGISLARKISDQLPAGYSTKLSNGKMYGEALLTPTHIYSKLLQDLQRAHIDLHYASNITGHGLRKIMRARGNFTYTLEHIFKPQEVFVFIQKHSNASDYEMYQTFNMGQDYALFLPKKDVAKTLEIIRQCAFTGLDAGYIQKGTRQVLIKEKNIVFNEETLNIR